MPNYRRAFVPGGCFFFTVNLFDRKSKLLVEHIDALYVAIETTQGQKPFQIDALVILPNHIHAVWTLPAGDADFSSRWRDIKAAFSKSVPARMLLTPSQARRGERGIWQRRFWEHVIEDEKDLLHHIDYCWYNPVKHGLVQHVEDWPYSTFHRDTGESPLQVDTTLFEVRARDFMEMQRSRMYGEPD